MVTLLLKLIYFQFENVKIKTKNAKLRNPDFIGIADFIILVPQTNKHGLRTASSFGIADGRGERVSADCA